MHFCDRTLGAQDLSIQYQYRAHLNTIPREANNGCTDKKTLEFKEC